MLDGGGDLAPTFPALAVALHELTSAAPGQDADILAQVGADRLTLVGILVAIPPP